jgi:serine O-acetyltransferase
MGLFRKAAQDAFELARSLRKDRGDAPRPSVKEAVKAAASQDGYKVLLTMRLREAARRWHVPGANHLLRLSSTVLYGIEINTDVELGPGVNFAHTLGIILGGDAKIGPRVKFYGNNTVGTVKDNGYPVIEEDVVVGAGARVLGPVRIGARSVIGANAVVLHDVPPDSVVSGIPARIHPRKGDAPK